jgi:hypothetical protein
MEWQHNGTRTPLFYESVIQGFNLSDANCYSDLKTTYAF